MCRRAHAARLNIAACLLSCKLKSVQEEMEIGVPVGPNPLKIHPSQLKDLQGKRRSFSKLEEWFINPSDRDDEVSDHAVLNH